MHANAHGFAIGPGFTELAIFDRQRQPSPNERAAKYGLRREGSARRLRRSIFEAIFMTPEHTRAMARYNRWMNDKLYAVAEKLTDEERKKDRGAFFGSIHRTLNHLLVADRIWLGRFTGAALAEGEMGPGGIRSLDQELYADFDELRRERARTDDELDAFVATLTAEKLAGSLRYLRRGVVNEFPLRHAVAHLFNHQTHHRGQVTTLLMQAGHDPGVTDLLAMLRG